MDNPRLLSQSNIFKSLKQELEKKVTEVSDRMDTFDPRFTFATLNDLKAALPSTIKPYVLITSKGRVEYSFVLGDFRNSANDVTVVKLNTVNLNDGALVVSNTNTAIYKAAGSRSKFRSIVDTLSSFISTPQDKGAVGDGKSALVDQQGMADVVADTQATGHYIPGIDNSYWTHPQDSIYLPAGEYDAGDLEFIGNVQPFPAIQIHGDPGQTIIRIPDGKYAFKSAERISRIDIRGITFVGGKGAIQLTHTGNNVNGFMRITDCYFDNYTECAIGNNANDAPYLHVEGCTFMGKTGVPTIGIAWGGYADLVRIVGNAFLRNRYHVKLGPYLSGSSHLVPNDYIRWDKSYEFGAALWIVPNDEVGLNGINSGFGSIISGKFGNENLEANDCRILIAKEGVGTNRQTRFHSTTWYPNGAFVSGITIQDSRVANLSSMNSPFIRSYIGQLRSLTYRNNSHNGGPHSYLCEFMGTRTNDYTNMNWNVEISLANSDTADGGRHFPFARGISNALVGVQIDPYGLMGSESQAMLMPGSGGNDTEFLPLVSADSFSQLTTYAPGGPIETGQIMTSVGNHEGKNRAANIVTNSVGGGLFFPIPVMRTGEMGFFEMDLKAGAENSCASVRVSLANSDGRRIKLNIPFTLTDRFKRLRIPFQATDTSPNWQLLIRPNVYSATSKSFQIGRVRVYHAREPMHDGHLHTLSDGKWDGGHLVMGKTHVWEEAGALYMKITGAPNNPTDGTKIGGA